MRLAPCVALLVALLATLAAAQTPDATALMGAVTRGDTTAVRALLARRVDVNAADATGTTALHQAAETGRADIARLLMVAGANVRTVNRYGVTALHLAAVNGDASMATLLLEAGADPNAVLPEGETVLMTAARTGSADLVRLLIEHGADVKAKETWRGQTALMWAIAENHLPVVRILLENGADINAKTGKGFTPFLFAVRGGDFDIVRALLAAGANVNETGGEGTTALAIAIVNAHFELASFLLDQGADPNVDMPGGSALHAVTRTRNYEYGTVVRPAAVQTGSMDALALARKLLDYGANVDARIEKPLPRQGGFDNNYLRLNGATPFLMAARAADPTLMRLLLEYGADPTLSTSDNVTPLMVAAGMGYVQGQSIGAPELRLEAVKLLLDLGADVHARTLKVEETAMHGAATGGVNAVVEILYEHGASLDAKDKDGTTPLMIADGTKSNFRRWDHTAELLRRLLAQAAQQ